MAEVEKKNGIIYLDGNSFADDIFCGCMIQKSKLVPETSWLTFDSDFMDKQINIKFNSIINYIFQLRKQARDADAIDFSDTFFQSFTLLMKYFVEQKNYSQVNSMWEWLLSKVRRMEESQGIEFGEGVHKGTAFFFLGFSRLMTGNVDGAYLSFAEAAKEDEILPSSVLDRHQNGLPPVVKLLLFDLSDDYFAYHYVRQIREAIVGWEHDYPHVSRSISIFASMQNAIDKNLMPHDSAISLCHAFMKAFVLNSWIKSLGRPTFLTISQLGYSIFGFARTLEDFIAWSGDFKYKKSINNNLKLFNYCHDEWFALEKWDDKIPNYNNNINDLIDDFILNNKWKLSKDGRNLLFTVKIRNALAHKIPNDQKIFENYIEIILAISSSFGFVCDKISMP